MEFSLNGTLGSFSLESQETSISNPSLFNKIKHLYLLKKCHNFNNKNNLIFQGSLDLEKIKKRDGKINGMLILL